MHKREADAESQRTKVCTAAEEIFERFPRRRFKTRQEKMDNSRFLRTQAVEKRRKEDDEKSTLTRECANRNAFLSTMARKVELKERAARHSEKKIMRTVWFNQAERSQMERTTEMLKDKIN
jgi:hypothetical protein